MVTETELQRLINAKDEAFDAREAAHDEVIRARHYLEATRHANDFEIIVIDADDRKYRKIINKNKEASAAAFFSGKFSTSRSLAGHAKRYEKKSRNCSARRRKLVEEIRSAEAAHNAALAKYNKAMRAFNDARRAYLQAEADQQQSAKMLRFTLRPARREGVG